MRHSVHLLAGAFALDALDESERVAFAAHLQECDVCGDEAGGLVEAAGLLSHLTAVRPAPELRRGTLVGITHVRPLPPAAPAAALSPPVLRDAAPLPRRPRRWVGRAAAAAVVAVVGAGTAAWWAAPDDQPAAVGVDYQVLHASDRKRSTVESDTGWAATVWRSDTVHRAVLITTNLPAPPAGMVYQVWLDQPSTGLVSAGLMTGEPDQSLLLQGDAATANGLRVTLEPEGGSSRPTSGPVAVFDFGQGA